MISLPEIGELWKYARGEAGDGDSWPYKVRKTETEWKYKYEGDRLVLAFKYTDSRFDWLLNFFFLVFPLLARKKPYKDMPVIWYAHLGMVIKWKSVEAAVRALVEESCRQGIRKVLICGHSQGGGTSILCHEMVYHRFPAMEAETHTFGSLRPVFGGSIAERFRGLHCWKSPGDIVPHLPPRVFGYVDMGIQHTVGKKRFPWPWNWRSAHLCYGDEIAR
jgi:hypothetical protein